jgi:hypothetical protein
VVVQTTVRAKMQLGGLTSCSTSGIALISPDASQDQAEIQIFDETHRDSAARASRTSRICQSCENAIKIGIHLIETIEYRRKIVRIPEIVLTLF